MDLDNLQGLSIVTTLWFCKSISSSRGLLRCLPWCPYQENNTESLVLFITHQEESKHSPREQNSHRRPSCELEQKGQRIICRGPALLAETYRYKPRMGINSQEGKADGLHSAQGKGTVQQPPNVSEHTHVLGRSKSAVNRRKIRDRYSRILLCHWVFGRQSDSFTYTHSITYSDNVYWSGRPVIWKYLGRTTNLALEFRELTPNVRR